MSELKPCPYKEIDSRAKSLFEALNKTKRPDISFAMIRNELIDLWNTRADGWISVEYRLPEYPMYALCVYKDKLPFVAWFNGDLFTDNNGNSLSLDHWQPLPSCPEAPK